MHQTKQTLKMKPSIKRTISREQLKPRYKPPTALEAGQRKPFQTIENMPKEAPAKRLKGKKSAQNISTAKLITASKEEETSGLEETRGNITDSLLALPDSDSVEI